MKYLIVLNKKGKNQLEICHSIFAKQTLFPAEEILKIDTANSYEEALKRVEKITQEVYEKTGSADLRTYLLEKFSSQEESVGK